MRKYINKICGENNIKIFSKIETINGIKNYNRILNVSDGIIIARGDLVPECGLIESVKKEFELLNKLKRQVYYSEIIIATHVLDSMKHCTSPNINEVESIYNFIKNGVTGFLLAGETSVGKNPVKTASYLKKLIETYEE